MSEQLYNPGYLAETQRLLENLKKSTYAPFSSISGKMAEVGCGTGNDAINIAKAAADSRLEVIGIDISEEMIGKARSQQSEANANEHQKDRMTNVQFMVGPADQLPFEDGELAGLRTERLVQHLSNPSQVFAEFHRVMASGSPLIVVETDWNSISFYNGDPEITKRLREYLTYRNVNNGNAAATLMQDLQEVGFKDVNIRLWPLFSHSLEQCIQLSRLDIVLEAMLRAGEFTSDEVLILMDALKHADRHRHFMCSINLVVVGAKR